MKIEEVFGSLSGLNGPDTIGNIGSFFGIIVQFLLVGGVLGAFIFYFAKRGVYKIEVDVFMIKAGKIVEVMKDSARLMTSKNGASFIQLKKLKRGALPATLPRPPSKYMYKVGKKNKYFLFYDDNEQLHPTKMDYSFKEMLSVKLGSKIIETEGGTFAAPGKVDPELRAFIKPVPEDLRGWARQEDKRQQEKLKERDKLKELLLQAAPLITGVLCFLILYFMFQTIGTGFKDISDGLAGVATSCLGK